MLASSLQSFLVRYALVSAKWAMVGSLVLTAFTPPLSMATFLAQAPKFSVRWNLEYLAVSSSNRTSSIASLRFWILSCSLWSHSLMGSSSIIFSILSILSDSSSCSWKRWSARDGVFSPSLGEGPLFPLLSMGSVTFECWELVRGHSPFRGLPG